MNRIKELRIERGYVLSDIAKILDVSIPLIKYYENGQRNPSIQKAAQLAAFFNVSIDYLLGNSDIKNDIVDDVPTKIPVVGKISAGLPILATENIETYEYAPSIYIKEGFEYFYLRVNGDSMNLKFNDGDLLLVQKQDNLENDEIGVILVDGMDATVKKYKYENGLVILSPMSTNTDHIVQIYNPKDINIKIIGKVVSYQGKV